MSQDPSQDECPDQPGMTHHLVVNQAGEVRCAYCGRSRSELAFGKQEDSAARGTAP